MEKPIDALIVGGGPAGMSAALLLGRCLRDVVVCDSGRPRNAAARQFNGFLSRDGSSPAEFRRICREELKRYKTVRWLDGEVTAIKKADEHFVASLSSGERIISKNVLLAPGLVDELPNLEGLHQFYGASIHSCPFCDGFECQGEAIAVHGGSQEAADLALELRQWSSDVILCSDGQPSWDAKTAAQLRRLEVRVEGRRIRRLEGSGSQLEAIIFADGTSLPRTALFFSPRQQQHTNLAESLGCTLCEETGCIECDETMCTSVPGLYAAGNASQGVQMVVFAAAEGARAAVAIQNALLEAQLRAIN